MASPKAPRLDSSTSSPTSPIIHTDAPPPASPLAKWQLHTVIACLFFGQFLVALDMNIITVALPSITSQFQSLQDAAWYSTAYIITVTAFQPLFGSVYKFFPSDVVYRISVLLFEVGSIICAAATNSVMFISGRAVAGIGGAGLLQGALSIINETVPLEQRTLYTSVVISVFLIAATAGPTLGGAFTQTVSWRWCFWINVPVGAAVFVGLSIFLRTHGTQNRHRTLPLATKMSNMDPFGCVLSIGAACCVLLALQWGSETTNWASARILGCLIGGVALAALFIYWQGKRQETALITPRVFKRRSIWTGAMTLFFLGIQAYALPFFLSFWFQGIRDATPVSTGVSFIARLVPQFIVLIITSIFVKKFGHYVPFMLLGELVCLGGQAMLTQLEPDASTTYWAASFVLTGIGAGMAQQLPYTAVAVVLADEDIPTGNAMVVFFQQLGGALSISLGQTIILSTLLELVPERLPHVPVQAVVSTGGTSLASLELPSGDLEILRDIWNTAIKRTMILATVAVGTAVPFTLAMDWLNVNKVAEERKAASTVQAQETKDQTNSHTDLG